MPCEAGAKSRTPSGSRSSCPTTSTPPVRSTLRSDAAHRCAASARRSTSTPGCGTAPGRTDPAAAGSGDRDERTGSMSKWIAELRFVTVIVERGGAPVVRESRGACPWETWRRPHARAGHRRCRSRARRAEWRATAAHFERPGDGERERLLARTATGAPRHYRGARGLAGEPRQDVGGQGRPHLPIASEPGDCHVDTGRRARSDLSGDWRGSAGTRRGLRGRGRRGGRGGGDTPVADFAESRSIAGRAAAAPTRGTGPPPRRTSRLRSRASSPGGGARERRDGGRRRRGRSTRGRARRGPTRPGSDRGARSPVPAHRSSQRQHHSSHRLARRGLAVVVGRAEPEPHGVSVARALEVQGPAVGSSRQLPSSGGAIGASLASPSRRRTVASAGSSRRSATSITRSRESRRTLGRVIAQGRDHALAGVLAVAITRGAAGRRRQRVGEVAAHPLEHVVPDVLVGEPRDRRASRARGSPRGRCAVDRRDARGPCGTGTRRGARRTARSRAGHSP